MSFLTSSKPTSSLSSAITSSRVTSSSGTSFLLRVPFMPSKVDLVLEAEFLDLLFVAPGAALIGPLPGSYKLYLRKYSSIIKV